MIYYQRIERFIKFYPIIRQLAIIRKAITKFLVNNANDCLDIMEISKEALLKLKGQYDTVINMQRGFYLNLNYSEELEHLNILFVVYTTGSCAAHKYSLLYNGTYSIKNKEDKQKHKIELIYNSFK